jgi:hypothetical protein
MLIGTRLKGMMCLIPAPMTVVLAKRRALRQHGLPAHSYVPAEVVLLGDEL